MSLHENEGFKLKMKLAPHKPSSPQYTCYQNSSISESLITDYNKPALSPPTSSTTNPTSSNDLVVYIDGNANESLNNPQLSRLIDKLSENLELDSSKKRLEADEKRLQISILEEDKSYKSELNKHDLLQKTFDLKKV